MTLLDRIRGRKTETVPEPGYWWWIGKGSVWGNHISWMTDQQSFYGHGSRAPEVDDMLHSERTSGRTAVFRVTEVNWQRDPSDMFIGKVECLGYVDELTEAVAFGKGEAKSRVYGTIMDDFV